MLKYPKKEGQKKREGHLKADPPSQKLSAHDRDAFTGFL